MGYIDFASQQPDGSVIQFYRCKRPGYRIVPADRRVEPPQSRQPFRLIVAVDFDDLVRDDKLEVECLYGHIVGMNSAIASRSGYYQGYTLAIPSKLILPVVSQLMEHGRVTRGVLGATTSRATSEDALAVGLATICGVVVQDVGDASSPAHQSGLRPGDVIVEVDGYAVMSVAQLQQSVWFKSPGDSVVLTVHREAGVVENMKVYLAPEQIEDQTASSGSGHPDVEVDLPCAQHPLGICVTAFDRVRGPSGDFSPDKTGPVVTAVYPAGPSYGKLFADYDIITHVNNVRVRSESDLENALIAAVPGDIVSVQTYRIRSDETGFARIRIR